MRLIDADSLMRKLAYSPNNVRYREFDCDNFPSTLTLREAKKLVREEPTVRPWVETADRLPDKCDETKYLIARQRICGEWHTLQVTGLYIKKYPTRCPWWMPIPPLPETFARGHENGGNHADK